MTDNKLVKGLANLSGGDKTLLKAFVLLAVLALALGLGYGMATAFTRAGFVELEPQTAYKMLTLHGVTIFFYWLYFVQAGFVLVLATIYTEGSEGIAWKPLAWTGFAFMTGGFILSELMPILGAIILYDARPHLIEMDPILAAFFYLGYILLACGLFLIALSGIATTLIPRFAGKIDTWSSISFASVAWAGLLLVSAVAMINVFFPAMLWTFGLGPPVTGYAMGWSVLFHNVHYLPLMATVVIWYVLVEAMSGVKSIFGEGFSKVVFTLYLLFVPPTSLYHLFLEPNLTEAVRVLGSLLSLFMGVPTVLVFLVIIVSLETHARAQGGRGLFGWIRMLPWGNPAMAAVGMAVVNLALGGVFSYVLIQEQVAPLLSDTFLVPGYFHFLTLGTVTLSFIAALMYVIPGITGHPLWRPSILAKVPYVLTFGLVIFGGAGITAGYMGVPRRVFDIYYDGNAPALWEPLMVLVGIGSVFMSAALAVYVYGLARTLFGRVPEPGIRAQELPMVSWGGIAIGRQSAWVGPLSVVVLFAAMFVSTVVAFELMESLPIIVEGGAAH